MRAARALLLPAWFALVATVSAAPALRVEPAFAAWRRGDLAPLRVSLRNDGPQGEFTLSSRTVAAPASCSAEHRFELAAGARKVLWLALQPADDEVEVVLSSAGRAVARATVHLRQEPWSQELIACLGEPPPRLASRLLGPPPGGRASLVSSTPALLPDEALLWPDLDRLIWPAPRAAELSPRQAEALQAWLVDGGRLLAGRHREDPQALTTLGLLPAGAHAGEWTVGWGRVSLVDEDFGGADVETWQGLLDLPNEPPRARRIGPELFQLRALDRVTRAVSPPLAAASLLLGVTIGSLVLLPWSRARAAARGAPVGRGARLGTAALLGISTLAALALAGGGAGRGLALDRLDVIDLDAEGGLARAHSIVALRRARSGPTNVDTRGAGRLRVVPPQPLPSDGEDSPSLAVLARDASSSTTRLPSWDTLEFEVRWRPQSLALPDPASSLDELLAELGAVRAVVKRGPNREWLVDAAEDAPDDVANATRWLRTQQARDRQSAPTTLRQLMEASIATVEPDEQWRWPTNERWRETPGEGVLIALAPSRAGPPLQIDGRPAEGETWTLWRVRLPGLPEASP